LKEELKRRNLEVSGRKADLQKRLIRTCVPEASEVTKNRVWFDKLLKSDRNDEAPHTKLYRDHFNNQDQVNKIWYKIDAHARHIQKYGQQSICGV
jgi:hypothetical protein